MSNHLNIGWPELCNDWIWQMVHKHYYLEHCIESYEFIKNSPLANLTFNYWRFNNVNSGESFNIDPFLLP